ncbi:UDP-N-acetylglucosamine enolpyruvyl transferase [Rothia mucilaginosa DY-18]|uniref:UDP-N-acetylglucosamine enolpyruvyl transferase n=1 Tax=Rothia mucilaginosa (strain DY-18) TaxID=680646 RepID=D2NRX9_ROTMD|nr:UDP-N-acetylglucosamine enolpyruvyl transferase [Rothia mucilaginosa DY-18]
MNFVIPPSPDSQSPIDQSDLDVEAELHHVAVLHDVVLALHTDLTASLRLRHGASLIQILERHNLSLNEAALKIRVNHTSGLRRSITLINSPGASLLRASSQVSLQTQGRESHASQLIQTGLILTVHLQHLASLLLRQLHQISLQLRIQEHSLSRRHHVTQLLLLLLRRQNALIRVEHVNERLSSQQVQLLQVSQLQLRILRTRNDGVTILQDLLRSLISLQLSGVTLLNLHSLLQTRNSVLQSLQVSQNQLSVNGLHIGGGVDLAVHVNDVRVIKRTHHLRDSVRLTNVREELVTQALTLRSALHNTRNINERNSRRQNTLRTKNLSQTVQTRIRQVHHAHVRVNGRERVVSRQHSVAGQSVEQGGLAHVRQANNADS